NNLVVQPVAQFAGARPPCRAGRQRNGKPSRKKSPVPPAGSTYCSGSVSERSVSPSRSIRSMWRPISRKPGDVGVRLLDAGAFSGDMLLEVGSVKSNRLKHRLEQSRGKCCAHLDVGDEVCPRIPTTEVADRLLRGWRGRCALDGDPAQLAPAHTPATT